MLYDQHKILAKLYSEDATDGARVAAVLANGYEGEYNDRVQHIARRTLSGQQGTFVRDLLLDYAELQRTDDVIPEEERVAIMAHPLDFSSPRDGTTTSRGAGGARGSRDHSTPPGLPGF